MEYLKYLLVLLCLAAVSVSTPAQSSPEYETYLAKIAAAEALIRIDEIGEAKMHLQTAPAQYRSWEWEYLTRLSDNSAKKLDVDEKGAYALAVSPDGALVATGGDDGSIRLWNSKSGGPEGVLEGHKGTVTTLDFSPDGKFLASGSADKTIVIWDVGARAVLRTVTEGLSQKIYEVEFHPDGRKLAAASWDFTRDPFKVYGFAKVFDVGTGKMLYRVDGTAHPASTVEFSRDGRMLAVGDWGALVQIADSETGEVAMKRDLYDEAVYRAVDNVSFSRDGNRLISVGKDKVVRTLDAEDGSTIYEIGPAEGHRKKINSVAFSASGRLYATASSDTLVKVWDAGSNRLVKTFRGHINEVTRLEFAPDDSMLYSVSADGDLRIWDLSTNESPTFDVCDSGPWSAPVLSDGVLFTAACSDKKIGIWKLDGTLVHSFEGTAANYAAYTNDGHPVTVGHDSRVVIWNVAEKKPAKEFKPHDKSLYGVDVSVDGLIAAGGDGSTAIVYGPEGEVKRLTYEKGHPRYVKFSPNGKLLALGLTDGTIDLVSTENWVSIRKLSTPENVMNLAFNDKGDKLLAGALNGNVTLWDLKSFELIHRFQGHHSAVFGIAFHPSGKRIATGGYDQTVKIWDIETGRQVMTLRDFDTNVYTIGFFGDGNRLMATQTDGIVRIF